MMDCADELMRARFAWHHARRLIDLRVDGAFLAELGARGAIGVGGVDLSRDGTRWQPGGPTARLLLAMFDHGEVADVLAVSTEQPDQAARRTGFGWCLGFDAYELALAASAAEQRVTLPIVGDALEWLRRRGQALCVVDWGLALPLLRGLGERVTLECDAGAGARIKALLEIGGLPKVRERAPVARAAKVAA